MLWFLTVSLIVSLSAIVALAIYVRKLQKINKKLTNELIVSQAMLLDVADGRNYYRKLARKYAKNKS